MSTLTPGELTTIGSPTGVGIPAGSKRPVLQEITVAFRNDQRSWDARANVKRSRRSPKSDQRAVR